MQVKPEGGALEPGTSRRNDARSLAVFVAVSVTAHAVVFGILPQLARDERPPLPPLEVTVLKPEPLPVAPPEPEPPPPPKRKPEPPRTREPTPPVAKAAPTPQPEPAPVLSLPATQTPQESAFTVPAPKPAESPRAPEKPQAAGVATTPPVFNAAYLRNPAPQYPLAARRTGQQGTATVRVLVTPEGLPARVDLEKSSGSTHLDDAAVQAVKGWRFSPARRGTEAVEGWVLVPIVFRLDG